MSHIFISYSRSDIDFARYLRASLEAESFRVWMDEKQLSAGMDWWGEIEANIDNCSAFLVIMSPEARDSVFVQNEILRAIDQKKAIFPVLLSGKSFGILAHVQFQDMRGGLNATLSQEFIQRLRQRAASRSFRFEIVHNLVEHIESDVMVLKYAGVFFGADLQVSILFAGKGEPIDELELRRGNSILRETNGIISAKHALFLPTKHQRLFTYHDIRNFAENALSYLAEELPECRSIAMTIHGMGFGLDEQEAIMAQLGGIIDRLQSGKFPRALERISIVEFQKDRVKRLQYMVSAFLDTVDYASKAKGDDWGYDLSFGKQEKIESPDAGHPAVKPYAFVLLPHQEELDDIFFYGIQRPIHAMGLLCERNTDGSEALEDNLKRIAQARAFICDVSEMNPQVYLQLGYAMGKEIPVALISQRENPDFTKLIAYQKIWELEERLSQWLKGHF
jgi:hypothetical protein